MSQALVALKSARTYLNDTLGFTWSDSVLMPLLQEAHGELVQDLDLNSFGVLKFELAPITVPAGTLTLPNQPTNILEPISMMERVPGTDADFYQQMYKVNFLPETDQDNFLVYWSWMQETIQFVGATQNIEVMLRYKGSLITPQLATDPIGVIFGERFLGPRIAALAFDIMGKNSSKLNEIAQTNKYKLIQRNVLGDQTPVRRKGYRSAKLTYGPSVNASIPVGQMSGGTGVNWIATSTPPDGVRTNFIFPYIPKYVEWNGILQFAGKGYNLNVVLGQYTVTFIDVLGNILIPTALDDIREAY